MRFYSVYNTNEKRRFKYPCVILNYLDWDDFGNKTKFELTYYRNSKDSTRIGLVKILGSDGGKTELKPSFNKLTSKFCSLGQTPSYYENLKEELPNQYQELLEALNDVVYSPLIAEKFRDKSGFSDSLLRTPQANKAYQNGHTYFKAKHVDDKKIKFVFRCRVRGAKGSHEIPFSFNESRKLPQRTFVLIGKNGTGKTQVLSKLAGSLRGDKGAGKLLSNNHKFTRVLAISYSLFDNFDKAEDSVSKGYLFCGLKKYGDYLSDEMLSENIIKSLERIKELGRENDWDAVLSEIVPDGLESFLKGFSSRNNVLEEFSSGQSILIAILSDVISNIQDNSLILFDEPETHLHPNAIGKLLFSINALLVRFNSFSVISTHSPIVIQEVPSENIRVIEREGNFPRVRKISLESFGENLTTITNEIFGVSYKDSLYKRVLRDLKRNYTDEEIRDLFDNRLSFNASTYLANIE